MPYQARSPSESFDFSSFIFMTMMTKNFLRQTDENPFSYLLLNFFGRSVFALSLVCTRESELKQREIEAIGVKRTIKGGEHKVKQRTLLTIIPRGGETFLPLKEAYSRVFLWWAFDQIIWSTIGYFPLFLYPRVRNSLLVSPGLVGREH